MASNTSTQINSSDPTVAIQVQRENAALQRQSAIAAAPSVNGSSTVTTTTASRATRSIAPVVSGSEVLYPQSTTSTSRDAVTINSSVNNDSGDVTTVYSTNGQITVNPINQTINQYTSIDSGVSQIVAGNGVTITSTGGSGTGVVTINSGTMAFGNIVSINLDGNAANVLHGDGTWSADQTTYGNSNVVSLLSAFGSNTITTTGNVSVGNIIGNSTINIDNRNSGNAADIQLFAADDIVLQARDRTLGSTSEGGDINIYAGDSAEDGDSSGGDVQIFAGDGGAANVDFGGSGGFITIQSGRGGAAIGNSGYSADNGGDLTLSAGDAGDNNGNIDLGSAGGAVFIESGFSTGGGDYGGEIVLTTGTGGQNAASGNVRIVIPGYGNTTGGTWKFDGTGNLTLPGNTFAVNYANGTAVSIGGGGANTGNVTFSNVTVQGDNNGLNLSAGADFTANLAYLQVRAGDVASHIHLDTGNNEAYDLIVGDDQNYVQVSSTGNILLSSYDSNTAQYTWTLDYNGNLILAGGNSVIQSIANSSLDTLNPNVSTMVLTPDPGYYSQSLVLDPTAPGHIHLRAPAFSNIDEPAANIFLGGEDTSFEVTYGANNEARIHSGGNTWTFGNTGILTLPGEGVIRSLNDTVILQSVDTVSGDNVTLRLGTNGAVYFENSTYPNNWLNISTNPAGDANLVSPLGNINITPAIGVANAAGKSLNLQGGAADQSDFYTGTGGAVNITGGLGSSDDGGGGGPGGNVNITSGNSSDPAGHAGNINITAGNYDWVFDYNGDLTLPGNLVYIGASPAPSIRGFSSVSALQFTNGNSNVTINANSNTWNFDSTGNLTIPSTSGGFIKTASNASIGIAAMDNGTNNPAQLLSMNVGTGAATSIVSAYATNATIQTNAAGAINTWSFDNAGNLTLPANTFAINYANGTQVSLGGGNISNISNGNSNVNIATANGNVTIAAVGNTTMTITGTGANITGTANISGNLVAGNLMGPLANGNSSVSIATAAGNVIANVNGSTVFTAYSGGIKVGGSGILQSPGGAGAITLNNNGANIPTANITTQLNVTGASGANITANLTAGNISTGGALAVTGNAAVTGTLTSTGKIGYASGSTVTQTTNRGNGVTINALAGTIVTTSAAMVANEIDTFSVINSSVDPNNDIVLAQIVSPNQGTYNCIAGPALIGGFSNGFYINIVNISGFTTSDETITVRFMVFKAPNA
jgi:hypothetical protein